MTHFIRDENNYTLVDCEVGQDISCVVCLQHYSNFLLSQPSDLQGQVIVDFSNIQEIRGCWYEGESGRWPTMQAFVEHCFRNLAAKWNLAYITD